MLKPICVPCQRFYRPTKNGFLFTEGMPKENFADPGKDHSEQWKPYKLWMGDKWTCPDCESEIIVGTGMSPIAEHYQPNFHELIKKTGAELQINDC